MLKFLIVSATVALLLAPLPVSTVTTAAAQHDAHARAGSGPVANAVREAIKRYRDVNVAIADGYAQFQGCVSGPQEGAMGVHFAKGEFFDGQVVLENPEVLVYEPRNGRLHLVAAEYVVPAEAWDPSHDEFDKPHLKGHLFQYIGSPNRYGGGGIYELHVWALKDNPRGTFADWNRTVSCDDWVQH